MFRERYRDIDDRAEYREETFIFSMHIDFANESGENRQYVLKPGGRYYFEFKETELGTSEVDHYYETYEEMVVRIKKWIEKDFVAYCGIEEAFPSLRIRVLESNEGSIQFTLAMIVEAVGFISGLKDMYELCELIKGMLARYISKRLKKQYGRKFTVRTEQVFSKNENKTVGSDNCAADKQNVPNNKRDAFFYYLLITNIGLIAAVAALVYKAVAQMYWGG